MYNQIRENILAEGLEAHTVAPRSANSDTVKRKANYRTYNTYIRTYVYGCLKSEIATHPPDFPGIQPRTGRYITSVRGYGGCWSHGEHGPAVRRARPPMGVVPSSSSRDYGLSVWWTLLSPGASRTRILYLPEKCSPLSLPPLCSNLRPPALSLSHPLPPSPFSFFFALKKSREQISPRANIYLLFISNNNLQINSWNNALRYLTNNRFRLIVCSLFWSVKGIRSWADNWEKIMNRGTYYLRE